MFKVLRGTIDANKEPLLLRVYRTVSNDLHFFPVAKQTGRLCVRWAALRTYRSLCWSSCPKLAAAVVRGWHRTHDASPGSWDG